MSKSVKNQANGALAPSNIMQTLPARNAPNFSGLTLKSPLLSNSYTINELVGEGAFSWVFACTDRWGDARVAKILKPIEAFEVMRQKALAEISSLRVCRSPYVTTIFDDFTYGGYFFIIMERCAVSLRQILSRPTPNGYFWFPIVAKKLLRALESMHDCDMVHQDVHLGNVFLGVKHDDAEPTKRVAIDFKLGDLGLAKVVHQINPGNSLLNYSAMPPEHLDPATFGPADRRVDIYQSGLVLLQLVLGRELCFSRKETLDGLPRQLALQLPAPHASILERALRRRARYRFATAYDFWDAIHAHEFGDASMPLLQNK